MDHTIALIQKSHDGDEEARARLVEENAGLVWCIVKRFYNRGVEAEDLFQVGNIGQMCIRDRLLSYGCSGNRIRYHLLLGNPYGILRICPYRENSVPYRVHPRPGKRLSGPQDEQVIGQRHRSAGDNRAVRRGCPSYDFEMCIRDRVITQNIDGLHQAAGSRNVLELHGSILRNYCQRCGKSYDAAYVKNSEGIPKCSCGGTIKPDVVLYEESLDSRTVDKSIRAISEADTLIIGGTSLIVYPAAGLDVYKRQTQPCWSRNMKTKNEG